MMKIKHAALATALSICLFSGSAFATKVTSLTDPAAMLNTLTTHGGGFYFTDKSEAKEFADEYGIEFTDLLKSRGLWLVPPGMIGIE